MSDVHTDLSRRIGVVAIGRNEGERLIQCLRSVTALADKVVYVDSGSTDGSREAAKELQCEVLELDLSRPFTAARARNEGVDKLLELAPEVEFVQFIDGDCVLDQQWMQFAADYLDANPSTAVVCGRRREKFPERSIYNRLCDLEWNTPIGVAKACGGDSLMRIAAFREVGGFRPDRIAGEEPELCFRLRKAGHEIYRLDADMTLHDAAIFRFGQWWKRTVRAGYSFASGAWLHGASEERFKVRECLRACLWGGLLPLAIVVLSLCQVWFLLLFLIYPLQIWRLSKQAPIAGRDGRRWAFYLVLGKFAECVGVFQFLFSTLTSRTRIIEYK